VCYVTDWFSHGRNSLVHFTATWHTGLSVQLDGTPFLVIGCQVLECASGREKLWEKFSIVASTTNKHVKTETSKINRPSQTQIEVCSETPVGIVYNVDTFLKVLCLVTVSVNVSKYMWQKCQI